MIIFPKPNIIKKLFCKHDWVATHEKFDKGKMRVVCSGCLTVKLIDTKKCQHVGIPNPSFGSNNPGAPEYKCKKCGIYYNELR